MAGKREVIRAEAGPKVLGPYSLGIQTEGFIFLSGTIGIDPASGSLVAGGVAAEARQALQNMKNLLEENGSDLASVVKTTVFLTNIEDYAEVNAVYAEYFSQDPPARSAVEVVALPGGAAVEMEAIALA
jgi:2-iminobutanoate/2-iminopropanoate deaminase